MNLKDQLKFYLDQHKLSVLQLSKQTKVPNATLAEWLKGRSPKKMDQVKAVADFFDVSIDHLCYGDGEEKDQIMELDDIIGNQWLSGTFEVRLRRVKKAN